MLKTLLTFSTIITILQLTAQENAQWRGENRDGIYNETGLLKQWPDEGPKLLWHFDNLGAGHASAAVTDKFVYTAGTTETEGFVIAFDHDGNQKWQTIYGKEWLDSWEGVRSTPMINNGKLYIVSGYGVIYCMDANDGKSIWSVDLIKDYGALNIKWGITENLLIENDMLFCTVGGTDANVIALNKDTGKLIWKSKGLGEKSAYHSPLAIKMGETNILVTQTESHILGINISNGTLLWNYEFPNKYFVHANTPLFHEGQLFCMSGYGKGGVMLKLSEDGSSITKLWETSEVDNRMGGFVLIDGKIYGGGDFSKKWFCIDWNTGKILYNDSDFKTGNIIYADGMLYCYSDGGEVALVEPNPESFKLISKFEVPYGSKQHWAHIVIHNKKLYVRHGESLMVYDISAN